jgi:DNA-binding winged helix-turn-helix (wHTH) protein/Flp pilus assembly protein TadD
MPVRAPAWRIGDIAFDATTGVLRDAGGRETALRPKTALLLRVLAGRAGQVMSRDALMDAVWPGVAVTDDSLTQCVAELRRALGPHAHLLRTLPKRGYVLDGVTEAAAPGAPPAAATLRPGRWAFAMVAVASCAAALLAARAFDAAVPRAEPHLLVAPVPPAEAVLAARAEAERLLAEARRAFYSPPVGMSRADNWLRARDLYRQATDADPTFGPAYAEAVFTHTNMVVNKLSADPEHDLREATRLAERAEALMPNAPAALNARAAVFRVQRRPAEAMAYYERAAAADPTQLPARGNAAFMLVLLGRAAEAVERLDAFLASVPEHHSFYPTWLIYRALALLHADARDRGAEDLRRSMNHAAFMAPTERTLHLAAALALSGQVEQARVALGVAAAEGAVALRGMRTTPLSDHPAYLAQREALFRGLAMAGLAD